MGAGSGAAVAESEIRKQRAESRNSLLGLPPRSIEIHFCLLLSAFCFVFIECTLIFAKETTMSENLIDYRVENGVAIFELNDPPANTYTYEMNKDLDTCILEARMDDAVHVIVMRGSGDKFFSAGANIKMLSEVTPGFKYYFCLHANETLNRLEQTPKLVIAAL